MLKPVEEYALALGQLGSMEWNDFKILTPQEQITYISEREDSLLNASGDMSLTDTQTDASNFLREFAKGRMTISGGAPITQTLETVRDVPDLEPVIPTKKGYLPPTQLTSKIDGLTPKMKLWVERTRREYFSGYKNLATMGPAGKALKAAAEHAMDIQDRGSTLDLRRLEPHQKALRALVKARTPKGAASDTVHARTSRKIWDFVEHDTAIEGDTELAGLAQGWKETWREIYLEHVVNMLQLRAEIESLNSDERLVIRRSDGSISKNWSPLLPDHTWHDDTKMFEDADGNMLTVEDAIKQSDKLYLPHIYPKSHWNAIVDQIQSNKVIQRLDKALKEKGNELPGFKYSKADKTWTFERTGDSYTNLKRTRSKVRRRIGMISIRLHRRCLHRKSHLSSVVMATSNSHVRRAINSICVMSHNSLTMYRTSGDALARFRYGDSLTQCLESGRAWHSMLPGSVKRHLMRGNRRYML